MEKNCDISLEIILKVMENVSTDQFTECQTVQKLVEYDKKCTFSMIPKMSNQYTNQCMCFEKCKAKRFLKTLVNHQD